MEAFFISEVYRDEAGRRTIGVSPVAEKTCSFDCVFCGLGRTIIKVNEVQEIKGTADFLRRYVKALEEDEFEVVYFDPNGEALANAAFGQMVSLAKSYGKIVRLLSNGWSFTDPLLQAALGACDEITVEIMVATEADYQRIHRPIAGMTLAENIQRIAQFQKGFAGKLTLCFIALKGISDDVATAEYYCQVLRRVVPNRVEVATLSAGPSSDPLLADEETLCQMRKTVSACFNDLSEAK
jgi:wyosine [tRNA(Phe)-imidazoG37] synthetase (radical SAM superfamily)